MPSTELQGHGRLISCPCYNIKTPTLGDNDGSGTASFGKRMAYSDFTLQKLKKDFGLQVDEQRNLLAAVELVAGSELLNNTLQETV